MRSGDGRAQAYPNSLNGAEGFGARFKRAFVTMAVSLMMVFLLGNVLFKDYKSDTKNYLVNSGRAGDVDKIFPKTIAERKKEAAFARLSLEQKITTLMLTIEQMRNEIEFLQDTVGNLTGVPIPHARPLMNVTADTQQNATTAGSNAAHQQQVGTKSGATKLKDTPA